jgi:beta-glucosidase
VARAIAGDFSPAGRLPVTFYRSADDLPAFGDYRMAGRTYRYFAGEVLYPFGHGLSYTRFQYGRARVSRTRIGPGERVEVSVDVTNEGGRDGDEVVQLYLSRPDVEGAPIRSLAGARRIHLAAGETRRVAFTLEGRLLSIVDNAGVRRIVPGRVALWVGGGQPGARAGREATPGAALSFEIRGGAVLPE